MSQKPNAALTELKLVEKQNGYSTIWLQVQGPCNSVEYQSLRLPSELAQLILNALEPVKTPAPSNQSIPLLTNTKLETFHHPV